jgi:hypothetical protein
VISPSQRPLPTQHTTNTRDEHPCPQRNWNSRSQQSPIPLAARSKVWVGGGSLAGIACSNSASCIDVSVVIVVYNQVHVSATGRLWCIIRYRSPRRADCGVLSGTGLRDGPIPLQGIGLGFISEQSEYRSFFCSEERGSRAVPKYQNIRRHSSNDSNIR